MGDIEFDVNKLLSIGEQSEGEIPRSRYRIDYKRPPADYSKVTPSKPVKAVITQKDVGKCQSYQQNDSLAETDCSPNSIGYMKDISEYKRHYYKQHNVENSLPQLNDKIEKLFSDFKDFAQLPKPQLVKPPYASMSIDSMPLQTKKKLLEKYYSSMKTYTMEDSLTLKAKEQLSVKTLEDVSYEKDKITLKNPIFDTRTSDEIEVIAPLFYKYHSDLKQITGLQAEILRLLLRSRQNAARKEVEIMEAEIAKKLERNRQLKKEFKLRIPYKKDYGFTGYSPNEATHGEERPGPKYPLFRTMSGMLDEQCQRRIPLEKFDTSVMKYYKECFNSQKVPVCFELNKLQT